MSYLNEPSTHAKKTALFVFQQPSQDCISVHGTLLIERREFILERRCGEAVEKGHG